MNVIPFHGPGQCVFLRQGRHNLEIRWLRSGIRIMGQSIDCTGFDGGCGAGIPGRAARGDTPSAGVTEGVRGVEAMRPRPGSAGRRQAGCAGPGEPKSACLTDSRRKAAEGSRRSAGEPSHGYGNRRHNRMRRFPRTGTGRAMVLNSVGRRPTGKPCGPCQGLANPARARSTSTGRLSVCW